MEENETPHPGHKAIEVSTSQQLANALARERGLLEEVRYLNELVDKLRSLRKGVMINNGSKETSRCNDA
jgi:hypothetical protein